MPDFTLSRIAVSERRKTGSLLPLEHDVQRLQQREAGLEQRRQLLPEDQQQVGRDLLARCRPKLLEAQAPPDGEEVVALLLQLGAQRGLVGGGEGLLHHLPARRADLADVFHDRRGPRAKGPMIPMMGYVQP